MKILFIGNSHTYMNDMPELARRMIEDATKLDARLAPIGELWSEVLKQHLISLCLNNSNQ